MRATTLAFIAASVVAAVNAIPLGENGSLLRRTGEKAVGAAPTAPPWRRDDDSSRFAPSATEEQVIIRPTSPPWKRSGSSALTHQTNAPESDGTPAADDAPTWKRADSLN
ncbi:hypothetical protein C8J57DRAFT_1311715 [Mycena rebaudengoi]|nr:hypothetical protein C8J57DRAFT_1311715 [Mycena rebaudengoi]